MGQKQCEQCGEQTDEAKAFCPACGHAFVEEDTRRETSKFEQMDHTVQMGQTMYNAMLSDMGLNISKTPEAIASELKAETAAKMAAPAKPEKHVEVIVSAAVAPPLKSPPAPSKSYIKWIIIAAAIVIFLFAMLVVIGAIGFYFYRRGALT